VRTREGPHLFLLIPPRSHWCEASFVFHWYQEQPRPSPFSIQKLYKVYHFDMDLPLELTHVHCQQGVKRSEYEL